MKEIKGSFLGKGKKIAIVISRFNEFISSQLLGGCLDTLKKEDVKLEDILIVWAPGCFEIPQVLSKLDTKKFDAIIALGVAIRGETAHFDYIASEAVKGIARLSLDKKVPITFGIITADTLEQAIERAGAKQGNKGRDAALSALEMASIYSQL
ncbi:MAG: 6,7-dimethyl-8-ribityllumazine synthase [Candidatus Omnitrophica bacterium]|nr:6,7-dimethyl-8-ribityllumazine synthase [Candidatus Omnitrophota bacterium]MBU0878196.1 6,7-dimethyl-8-ribityllumazine synthase [Candidatus Omnitrophota bacterium]MBU0896606.1 6,7-dimethyl-8-ribityllumazine synthase [Candidatus Omnitrophota bacterium]MBU1134140.1 6,7-dimethyl-8-ribityllumazine synthase [Candidatus Omnitrophota bacterium]MBU1367565.1 6,7-dimethyl-8-ribityllumazine synthase [Candidatus Omnitrophota bacterium]